MRISRAALLLLPLCLFALLPSCAAVKAPRPTATWRGGQALITLEYRGRARAVSVAGDFNGWNPDANRFVRTGDARWSCELRLLPGDYHYLLVINEDDKRVWRTDAANPHKTRDAKGRELSLLRVRGSGDETTVGAGG